MDEGEGNGKLVRGMVNGKEWRNGKNLKRKDEEDKGEKEIGGSEDMWKRERYKFIECSEM